MVSVQAETCSRTAALALALVALPCAAAAQVKRRPPTGPPTLRLTLDDAVRRAVENNPELAIVRLGTEVEAARVDESRSAFTPVFSSVRTFEHRDTSVEFSARQQGVDVNDWFSSTVSGSACRGAPARGALRGMPRERRPTTRSPASIRACIPALSSPFPSRS